MKKYLELKGKNPQFSVRALAQKLAMQPAATNEILKGQRRVSRKIVEKIADKLQLDPSERTDLLKDFPLKLKRNTERNKQRTAELEVLKLNADQFHLISDWLHFALLSLIKVKDFQSDLSWIAERFSVSTSDVRKALLKLQHLGLVTVDDRGVITRTPHPIRTTDDVRDLSLQQMHINDMELAKVKIQELRVDQRDFTNYTFPANPVKLAAAKEIIRKAQDDLEALMDDGDAQEVFRVCMYLFPLTQLQSVNKKEKK